MKRRQFLGSAPCAAMGSFGAINTLINLRLLSTGVAAPASGNGSDYRALVCIFLGGGNDSFNMLVPTQADEYANYSTARNNLALPLPGSGGVDALLPLSFTNTDLGGRSFGLHGAMPQLRNRFNEGNAAFVTNVGTLVEPITVNQFRSGSANVPRALFSHSDQQLIWQTSVADTSSGTGWAGRLADKVMAGNASASAVSMNISLSGNRLFLVGEDNFGYVINSDGSTLLTGSASNQINDTTRVTAARSLVEQNQRNILKRAFSSEKRLSFAAADAFDDAFSIATTSQSFGNSTLSQQLEAIAKTIASRDAFGHTRQIFFVDVGGFDNHTELIENQRGLLGDLDSSLASFWAELGSQGLQECVTTFTCSDFGRTLRSNGQGTDHAWGGHSFVMGGAVEGGRFYGKDLYPTDSDLILGGGLDVGSNGRILPTTSVDEYFAELALWFGLPPGDLNEVFPNLGNFFSFDPVAPTSPLGFMQSAI